MTVKSVSVTCTASGSAGTSSGTATTTTLVSGKIVGLYLDWSAGAAATTDTTVLTANSPQLTMLTLTNVVTDAAYNPTRALQGNTGTALTYDGTRAVNDYHYINDYVTVTLAQANNNDSVTLTLYYTD